jgi:predicted phage tail protein
LEAEVSTPAEAIRFLVANWPSLKVHMADRHYKVVVDNWEVDKDELHHPSGQNDIKIIPVIGGAGGNTTRIILGVALIGVALANPAFLANASIGTFGGEAVALTQVVGGIGVALALSGVAGLLTPVPKIGEEEQDPRRSFSFSGIQNTSKAGVAVPVIYGETMTGSVVISAAIDTVQVEV